MLESLFNNVGDLQACNFVKNTLWRRCFSVNITKFLRKPIIKNISDRLLLCKGESFLTFLPFLMCTMFRHKSSFVSCHSLCHFLFIDTRGKGLEKKMTKCNMGGRGCEKCYLASDLLLK